MLISYSPGGYKSNRNHKQYVARNYPVTCSFSVVVIVGSHSIHHDRWRRRRACSDARRMHRSCGNRPEGQASKGRNEAIDQRAFRCLSSRSEGRETIRSQLQHATDPTCTGEGEA